MNRGTWKDYYRVCESRQCKIRRVYIDTTHYKNVLHHYVNEYCKTCVLWGYLVHELKKEGKW